MGLFKSKEEKRIEREIEIRKGLNHIRRQIKTLEKNEKAYLVKARRALQMGASDQVSFLKGTLRKTITQRRLMERQLLSIETAIQIKDQVQAEAAFANAMTAVSKSIAAGFKSVDLTRTQKEFEESMVKARTMEERIGFMLEMSRDSMIGDESDQDDLVSDQEIDRLVEAEAAHEEKSEVDADIEDALREIRSELGKDRNG